MLDALVIVALVLAVIVLAVLILWSCDRIGAAIWRRRNPPEERAEELRRFKQRVADPDWAALERHLARPIPEPLRQLYANVSLCESDLIDLGEEPGCCLQPIHASEILFAEDTGLPSDVLPFARNMFGDPIYLRPGPFEPDVIYVTYHDGGDTVVLAEHVAELLSPGSRPGGAAGSRTSGASEREPGATMRRAWEGRSASEDNAGRGIY